MQCPEFHGVVMSTKQFAAVTAKHDLEEKASAQETIRAISEIVRRYRNGRANAEQSMSSVSYIIERYHRARAGHNV